MLLLAGNMGFDQVPDAAKLFALQLKFEFAFSVGLGRIGERRPHPTVPDDDITCTVMPFGDVTFKAGVIEGMVLYVNSQAFDLRVQRRTFGHGPALEGAVDFEAEIVMQAGCVMLLDTELQGMRLAALFGGRALGFCAG